MNIQIDDNGAAFLIVVNGLTTSHHSSLGGAWNHIVWMHQVATQHFTVGKNKISVVEWIEHMKAIGYID